MEETPAGPVVTPDQLKSVKDPAAREALTKALEERAALNARLENANQHLAKLVQSAGIESMSAAAEPEKKEEPARTASAGFHAGEQTVVGAVSASAEVRDAERAQSAREEARGKNPNVLPPAPAVRGSGLPREIERMATTNLRGMMDSFKGDVTRPEEAVMLYEEVLGYLRLGLPDATALGLLQLVSQEAKSRLAALPMPSSFEEWRKRFQEKYLSGTRAGNMRHRLAEQRRQSSEGVYAFLTRVRPMAQAAVLINVVSERALLEDLWTTTVLGTDYCMRNTTLYREVGKAIAEGEIKTIEALCSRMAGETFEVVPKGPPAGGKPANPATKGQPRRPRPDTRPPCPFCQKPGHTEDVCFTKHPELRAKMQGGSSGNNEGKLEYPALPVGQEVFVVDALVGPAPMKLGLDSMAALNLMREDSVPKGFAVRPGGPLLHGVGHVYASGLVDLPLRVGAVRLKRVTFAVVSDLPVAALLGKPTLSQLRVVMHMADDTARLQHGQQQAVVRAVAIPVAVSSHRPQAQAYWTWLNKRMAAAPKRLQTLFQDVMERADDGMLELYLAEFAEWALRQRQSSTNDDANVHPAPYQSQLLRPASVPSGAVVCPTTVKAADILLKGSEYELVPDADDSRDFLPPVMSFEEDDRQTDAALAKVVSEAEMSPAGKDKLRALVQKHRPAFGMQLRKVDQSREKVHVNLSGLPRHEPRRLIRDPRVLRAQMQWEDAMDARGVIGDLTGPAELARPINIHHVIRNKKIRFTGDARLRNEKTIPDSHPVPSPLEALERFRRNRVFSTFDEADSYFQYPYDVESRVPFYSAYGGIREFRVVVQGGMNSPAALHRFKAKQYSAFSPNELAYMFDDTLLGTSSDSEDVHLALLDQFLTKIVQDGTILKATKCHIFRSEVVHQGFVLSHGHYRKDPEAVRPLVDMRLPKTASELKSQMSMLGRYRNFVPEFSQLAAPLEDIMHDRWVEGTFTADHAKRLVEIRRQIARETLLTMPDWNRPFHWRIDAQPTFGWAGVVGQEDALGKFWPIRFMAKKASEADKKRWPTEMEAMAWYYCLIDKGRVYSQYSENIIHGDPKSLRWLADSIEMGRANRQMQRVALALQAITITFKYHPRAEMDDVDTLSRFALVDRSSHEALKQFLESDKPTLDEDMIIVAAAVPARATLPPRVAAASVVGPDSAPGVPIDISAEQGIDPVCVFIMTIKSGEFGDADAEEAFLAGMPTKAAAALRHHMATSKSRDFADFEMCSGKLMFIDVDKLANRRARLVLPLRLRARVLTANHDAPSAGHRGFEKTYGALMRLYFWFGMYADTTQWIKSCPMCAKGKRRTIAGHGTAKHMGLVPTKYPLFDRVVIDLIGPLLMSRSGMVHVLVIVDAYSSETLLVPLKTKNSEDIANILLTHVVLKEGCPRSWQTDRAPELLQSAVAKLAKLAGIEAKACSAYQAHTEGRVERRNWLIGMMLRELSKDDPTGWPDMLPWVQFAINTSPYSVTGMTPYFHKTGYDAIAPANAWREVGEDSGEPVAEWSKRMVKAYSFADLAHSEAAATRKEQYDKGKREHGIVDGDSVYVWIARAHKLEQSAMGPMTVKRFLDPATKRTAVLHPPGQPDETMVVHVDRLVKAHERPAHLVHIPVDLSDWIDQIAARDAEPPAAEAESAPQVTAHQRSAAEREQEVWAIESITGRVEASDGSRRYCVHYVGYEDAAEDRWYDEEDLRQMGPETIKMLDEYDAREDRAVVQQTIATKPTAQGVRQSARLRRKDSGT